MAVPAHDERDFAFARKYGLTIVPVIQPEGMELNGDTMEAAYIGEGVMINSGLFNGTTVNTEKGRKNPGISKVIDWLEQKGIGKRVGQLSLARLADLPPALLGRADPDGLLRDARLEPGARRSAAGAAAR